MGFAVAAIVGPSLNNPYMVRSIRESKEDFLRDRASRYLLGLVLLLGAQAFISVSYIVWFGLTIAGGELAFKAFQSRNLRDGNPNRTWRMDTIRQLSSIALAGTYLYATPDPTLFRASLLYCLPYLVIMVLAVGAIRGHRPQAPGSPRLLVILIGEMLGTTVYLQGDVLLLGYLTNTTVVGYYTLTVTVAVAIATIGQSFGNTYNEGLRASGGDLASGPPLRNTVTMSAVGGVLVFIVGLVMLATPVANELAVAMMVMAGFTAFRTAISVFQVILFAQRRDVIRFAAAFALVPFKLGLLTLLTLSAHLGAVGAAISSSITDAVLLTVFALALYRKRKP